MKLYAEMLNASASRTLALQTVMGQRQQVSAALAGQNGNLANPVPHAAAILLSS